jgi:hypothetical protein
MKNFIITSKVQSIKTLQYNVEADSLEEAITKFVEGEYRGEADEIAEVIDWGTEANIRVYEDIEDPITIPAGTKGVWVLNSPHHSAKFGAKVEVEFNYIDGDIISVKWIDDLANGQMDGGYFLSDFIFEK